MKKGLMFLWFCCVGFGAYSQGVELYGGYPVSLKARSESQKVSNWNNGEAGINVTAYIRSVAVQVGVGYMSNNYAVYNDWYRGNEFHQYIYVPVMVYPRLYTDGKNTLSIGVGCKVKFPVGKVKASIVYADGHTPGSYKGGYTLTVLPRISLRYSRSFGKRFLFFVDVFSEFNVKDNFPDGFNVMRGEWISGGVVWSLNYDEYAIRFQEYVDPMAIIANVAVAKNGGAFEPGPDASTVFPATFQIDYIRAWTTVDCALDINRPNYVQTAIDPTVLTGKTISFGSKTLPSASAVVSGGQYLSLVATESVRLLPGFRSQNGSGFWANVAPCLPDLDGMVAVDEKKQMGPLSVENQSMGVDYFGAQTHVRDASKNAAIDKGTSDNEFVESPKTVLYTRVYPNPTQGFINVEFEGKVDRLVRLDLINTTGQVVFTREVTDVTTVQIDVSTLPSGIYQLKCTFGGNFVMEKIIVN